MIMGVLSQSHPCALSPSSVPAPSFQPHAQQEEFNASRLPLMASKDSITSPPVTSKSLPSVSDALSRTKNTRNNSHRIPKFLRSLYTILQTEQADIVAWVENADLEPNSVTAFHILDMKRFEQEVLPKYFKHRKFASFQRQLNNFGFRKWTKTQSSGVCTFSHNCFPPDPTQIGMTRLSARENWKQKRKEADNVSNGPYSTFKESQFTGIAQNRPNDSNAELTTTLQLSTLLSSSRATKRARKTSKIVRQIPISEANFKCTTQEDQVTFDYRHSRNTTSVSIQHPVLTNTSSHTLSANMDVLTPHTAQTAGGLQEWVEFGVVLEDPPFLKQVFSAVDASFIGQENDISREASTTKCKMEVYGASSQYSFLDDLESQDSVWANITYSTSRKSVSHQDEPLTELSSHQTDGKDRFEACTFRHDDDTMSHYPDELILEKILFD